MTGDVVDVGGIDGRDVDGWWQDSSDLRNGPFWDGPRWLNNPSITGRGYLLMAMGVIRVALALPLADALAILRAHAFAADRTLDAAAHDIVTGILSPCRLTPDSNSYAPNPITKRGPVRPSTSSRPPRALIPTQKGGDTMRH